MTQSPVADELASFRDRQARDAAVLDKQLFFIASCSKSGSTWLQHLLDGHRQVCCYGEAFFPTHLRPLFEQVATVYNRSHKAGHERNRQQRSGDLQPDDVRHLYRSAVAGIMARWGGDHPEVLAVGDKTPENAVGAASLLDDFPEARIIHLIRDGRDVCVSGWFHNLREKGDAFRQQFPDLAAYIPVMAGQKWKPYIQHTRQVGEQRPEQYLEVSYEQLQADPQPTVARLLAFLGVDASEAEVRTCIDAGDFRRLSGGRAQGEEARDDFYRKGTAGDWRNHFDARCEAVFMQHAGDLLQQLGYAEA
ncbi:MAG: sulfotransferase [Phycisphaeraceae bacterium]